MENRFNAVVIVSIAVVIVNNYHGMGYDKIMIKQEFGYCRTPAFFNHIGKFFLCGFLVPLYLF